MIEGLTDTLRAAPAVADTLHAAAAQASEGGTGSMFGELLRHVQDSREWETPFGALHLPQFPPIHIAGIAIDLSITKHVLFLWVAAVILCTLAIIAARKNARTLVPEGFGTMVEVIILFFRDDVVIPNMGPGGLKYLPYLLTTFFFILIMNLLGLVPYMASSTGNVSVTAGLAVIALIMIEASSIKAQGIRRYLSHLTGGVHWALWPIMVPIEILSHFTKAFALCIRLFANMLGGHTVLVALLGVIFIFRSYIIAVGPVGFAVGIFFLELFVALLQAYIFTMLTSVFMGLGMQAEDHADHQDQSA